MANLMDGRSLGACENRCYDLYNDCLDVVGDGDKGCAAALAVCLLGCPIAQNIPATHFAKGRVSFQYF